MLYLREDIGEGKIIDDSSKEKIDHDATKSPAEPGEEVSQKDRRIRNVVNGFLGFNWGGFVHTFI